MTYYWNYSFNYVMRFLGTLNFDEWLILGIGVLGLGIICLRGFGSRTSY